MPSQDNLTTHEILNSEEWRERELEWAAERAAEHARRPWWERNRIARALLTIAKIPAVIVALFIPALIAIAVAGTLGAIVDHVKIETLVIFGLIALMFVSAARGAD